MFQLTGDIVPNNKCEGVSNFVVVVVLVVSFFKGEVFPRLKT